MPRNDDISLMLAKAYRSGFLKNVKDEELDDLQNVANTLFNDDDVLVKPNRLSIDNLPKWRAALAKVRKGDSDAKILFIGDSTTGQTSTINGSATISSYVGKFLDGLSGVSVVPGLALPPVSSALTNDTRWTAGTGWPSTRNQGFAQQSWQVSSPAGSLVYADSRINCDRYDIYYLQNSGFGTITATATGGSATPINTAGSVAINKATVSAGSAATSNTLTLTATGTCYVVGIEPWLSTAPRKVRIGNAGVPSSTSGTWVLANADFGAVPSIKKYAPDLTLIMLGVNDSLSAVNPAIYMSNIQQLITAAQVSGDVILVSPVVGGTTPYTTWVPLYGDILKNQSVPFIDVANRIGDWNGAWTTAGFITDQTHPNELGNTDLASFITTALKKIF